MEKMMKNSMLLSLMMLLIVGLSYTTANAGPVAQGRWVTISERAIIDVGERFDDVLLPTPVCETGTRFLVLGIHVGSEINNGSTGTDVLNLPPWAASVAVYQLSSSGAVQIALTAFSNGPSHTSASLPAGQAISGSNVHVRIRLLGSINALYRYEFDIHVTGACGQPFRP